MKFLQVYFIYSSFSKLMKFADCRLSSKNSCIPRPADNKKAGRAGHRVIKKSKINLALPECATPYTTAE